MAVINIDGIVASAGSDTTPYGVQINRAEYTSSDMVAAYQSLINIIKNLLDKRTHIDNGTTITDTRTTEQYAEDMASLLAAVAKLKVLAVNGLQSNVDPTNTNSVLKTYYLTTQMAGNLDLVFKTLKAAGITVPDFVVNSNLSMTQNIQNYNASLNTAFSNYVGSSVTLPTLDFITSSSPIPSDTTALAAAISTSNAATNITPLIQQWGNLAGFGISQVYIQALQDASSSLRSFQSMIELEYVKAGNQIIFGNLQSLESALSTTQNSINTLTQLQAIKNLQTITQMYFGTSQFTGTQQSNINAPYFPSAGAAGVNFRWFSGNNPTTVQAYASAGNQYFNLRYPTIAGLISAGGNWRSTALQLQGLLSQLKTQLSQLEAASPDNNRNTPGTLAANLFQIINDLKGVFSKNSITDVNTAPSTNVMNMLADWILDGLEPKITTVTVNGVERHVVTNPDLSQTGAFQTNLASAITSSQNLNDSQKQKVNNYLFLFQEFYKSASAVLQTITNIITKMADGINK